MDKKHGQGTFYWPNGVAYSGSWVDGKRHGVGWQIKGQEKRKFMWDNNKKGEEIFE